MKRKYVPNLTRQMAQCEANYARIMKLMPDLDSCDEREFQVSVEHHHTCVRLQVEERFTYTTTLNISQHETALPEWIEAPQLLVRLYHDAGMAEVICKRRRKQLSGVYTYPNNQMHLPDEKAQLNDYLGEWLSHCLTHGHAAETVFAG